MENILEANHAWSGQARHGPIRGAAVLLVPAVRPQKRKIIEMKIIEKNNQKIAEIISDEVVIKTPQDALDIMADASYYEARSLIIREENLSPEFFDLSTKIAGEILQKFSNYMVKMAIIGEFEKYNSESLKAFIRESNRGNQIFFVSDREIAIERLLSD